MTDVRKPKPRYNSAAWREMHAKETFQAASLAIGPVTHGMSLFQVTRGQFSFIDAIVHVLDEVGPAKISVWSWVLAEYEVKTLSRLFVDGRVLGARLILDIRGRDRNKELVHDWRAKFGADSVRYLASHAKIATVEGGGFRILMRGSMNLNRNPRFENFDISEGCPGFDLVREIEEDLPSLHDDASKSEILRISKLYNSMQRPGLKVFGQGGALKPWTPSKK